MIEKISGYTRFLKAIEAQPVDRPPIWMMRQAGRSLPEYLELKKGRNFSDLVNDPFLAKEITLQPLKRFDYDAAIVFSDILVVAEMMGINYEVQEKGGVKVDFDLSHNNDLKKISSHSSNKQNNTPEAIKLISEEIKGSKAIIGFAGSPWTLASYIIEGGSSKDNLKSRAIANENPKLLDGFLERITDTTIQYLNDQINAGADVIQIFDSQGGTLSSYHYWNVSGKWIKKIIDSLGKRVPFIVFARGVHHNWDELTYTGANALSIDWNINIKKTADFLPKNVAIQGNLDPALLTTNPDAAIAATKIILEDMKNRNGFIFNLGHGVTPNANIETIQAVTNTVQNYLTY